MIGRPTPEGDARHLRYRSRPGSNFIASGFALDAIGRLVSDLRPRVVLEVGSGIGTLTEELLDAPAGAIGTQIAVEADAFCLDQLAANIGERLDGVLVVASAADVPAEVGPYNLVIVDGSSVDDLAPEDRDRWTVDQERAEVAAWASRLAPRAVVIVENERPRQRDHLESLVSRPFLHEHIRPLDATPGFHRYRFDPTPVEVRKAQIRDLGRSRWFPGGVRLLRRVHMRLLGRELSVRAAVAPGESEQPTTR